MRFLLISDTHGKLGVIDEPATRVHADAAIHAGDFGFFDDGSFDQLSDRELRLRIVHSNLPRAEKDRILPQINTGSVAGGTRESRFSPVN